MRRLAAILIQELNMKQTLVTFAALLFLIAPALGTPHDKKQKNQREPCSQGCGRHGTCRNSACLCDPGWTGAGCKTKVRVPKAPKGR